MIAEIFGALGLLLPWAVLPSLHGLSVDMFGAVLTHIHNGDPLNDSTGAIGMLIRLAIVGALWALSRRTRALPHGIRNSILGVGAGGLSLSADSSWRRGSASCKRSSSFPYLAVNSLDRNAAVLSVTPV
jgi:hypothetical protein